MVLNKNVVDLELFEGMIGRRQWIYLWRIWRFSLRLMKSCLRKLPSCWRWIISGNCVLGMVVSIVYCRNYALKWLCIVYRENEQLSKYGDTKSARAIMLVELKKLIEANPLFRDKLQFPNLKNSRLRTLINQRYNIEMYIIMWWIVHVEYLWWI